MPTDLKSRLVQNFEALETKLNGKKAERQFSIRQEAMQKFTEMGFPTSKMEDWRFTSLNFLNEQQFSPALEPPKSEITLQDIEPFLFKNLKVNLLVFVNGFFAPQLSNVLNTKKSIVISNMADVMETNSHYTGKYFGQIAKFHNEPFVAVNTALSQDGAFILVPDGAIIDQPVHLMYINDTRAGNVLSFPRNMIITGECSQSKVIETYHTIGTNTGFSNSVTEIVMKFASHLDYYKIQNDSESSRHIGSTHIDQRKASVINTVTVSLNGAFAKNSLTTELNGEAAEANINGFYFLENQSFVENKTLVDHTKQNCYSKELYKGIINDSAHAVFNGKIIVRPDSQKTNAYQTNRNILLSDEAKINTKPQLEIYADDVKCSHGATSGNLDKEQLFYLQARGISPEMAQSLLLNAFAGEIIEKINVSELRDEIKSQVANRLITDSIYFCDVLEQNKM